MLTRTGCEGRLRRLADWMRGRRLDLVVVCDRKLLLYYANFLRQPYGWLTTRVEHLAVFSDGKAVLLCSAAERSCAADSPVDRVVTYRDYDLSGTTQTFLEHALEPFRAALADAGHPVRHIGVEKRHLPLLLHEALQEWYPGAETTDVASDLLGFRQVKDPDEIEALNRTTAVSELLYRTAARSIRAGMSEIELYAELTAVYARRIGTWATLSGDFVAGENGARTGGPPGPKRFEDGEAVLLDLWIDPEGYWADNARTFVVGGRPRPEIGRLYEATLRALARGERALRPGARGSDVYGEVRASFASEGLAESFTLHAGHGLGLSPHEAPLFIPASEDVLAEGMVCTLEPGLYVPGLGGVRCEDNYVIRASGPQRLTRFGRRLGWTGTEED
jgi:Xaa-Pro dipeptidase